MQAVSGQARRRRQADAVGDRQHLASGHHDLLGVAAACQQRAHLVAGLPSGDVAAHGRDAAGAFQAGIRRSAGRRRIEPLPLCQIRAVDTGGGDIDQHLVRSGRRIRRLHPAKDVGPAGLGDDDGMHCVLLS